MSEHKFKTKFLFLNYFICENCGLVGYKRKTGSKLIVSSKNTELAGRWREPVEDISCEEMIIREIIE